MDRQKALKAYNERIKKAQAKYFDSISGFKEAYNAKIKRIETDYYEQLKPFSDEYLKEMDAAAREYKKAIGEI